MNERVYLCEKIEQALVSDYKMQVEAYVQTIQYIQAILLMKAHEGLGFDEEICEEKYNKLSRVHLYLGKGEEHEAVALVWECVADEAIRETPITTVELFFLEFMLNGVRLMLEKQKKTLVILDEFHTMFSRDYKGVYANE